MFDCETFFLGAILTRDIAEFNWDLEVHNLFRIEKFHNLYVLYSYQLSYIEFRDLEMF